VIEEIILQKDADLIGLYRPFIREPNLVKKWHQKELKKASCISCNRCVTELYVKGKPLGCYFEKKPSLG
jgi:2,4-dienoyl-CoA reductase-like NADH-dependent reductase (Old Yellow Enzyme family)